MLFSFHKKVIFSKQSGSVLHLGSCSSYWVCISLSTRLMEEDEDEERKYNNNENEGILLGE